MNEILEKVLRIREAQREYYRRQYLEQGAHREGEFDYLGREITHEAYEPQARHGVRPFHLTIFCWRWHAGAFSRWHSHLIYSVEACAAYGDPSYVERSHSAAQAIVDCLNNGGDHTRLYNFSEGRNSFKLFSADELREVMKRAALTVSSTKSQSPSRHQ